MKARPETGTMRFAGDWRGVFIRGDAALGFADALREVRSHAGRAAWAIQGARFERYEELLALLESSDERRGSLNQQRNQELRAFQECVARGGPNESPEER